MARSAASSTSVFTKHFDNGILLINFYSFFGHRFSQMEHRFLQKSADNFIF